jgi:hypothetical protein
MLAHLLSVLLKNISMCKEEREIYVDKLLAIWGEWTNGGQATCSSLLSKNQKSYFYILKNSEFFFLDVANDGSYKHAKFQCEILSTLDYTKIINVWIS